MHRLQQQRLFGMLLPQDLVLWPLCFWCYGEISKCQVKDERDLQIFDIVISLDSRETCSPAV